LYDYVEAEFSNTWLPSHDHTHHLRVWTFAKDLVRTLYRHGCPVRKAKLEQLIIAIFFHDTGLTRTLEASHGKESREICRKFMDRFSSLSADDVENILKAVEKHDDKSYPESPRSGRDMPDDILTLLAVSDDLDAFGATGVFRYLEIYLRRNIQLRSMPVKIIENLEKRFAYLLQNYGDLKSFVKVHQKRYHYTVDFYRELAKQFDSASGRLAETGPVKVVNLLVEKVLREKVHLTEIASHYENLALDEYGLRYFRQLQSELP
jgi:hypothetical protein